MTDFFRAHGAQRLAEYAPQPPLDGAPADEEAMPDEVVLDYEGIPLERWAAIPDPLSAAWRAETWDERPVRFVDGKDVGDTIAWLRSPNGYPVPVRLSEIGATAVEVVDRECRRQFALVERVVSLAVDLFPWDEVEDLAEALLRQGFRLLPALLPDGRPSFDFEVMRKAAQNRSNTEMGTLEEAAIAQAPSLPTVIDGRLEPRAGGFDAKTSPAIGVVKTHHHNYLHAQGLRVVQDLALGERSPLFSLPHAKTRVVSWYVRLCGRTGAMPNWGLVRVELPLDWFETRSAQERQDYVARLSRLLCAYRCRDAAYARAAVSLHPIVRAEQLLGALFTPRALLAQRFCRVAGI